MYIFILKKMITRFPLGVRSVRFESDFVLMESEHTILLRSLGPRLQDAKPIACTKLRDSSSKCRSSKTSKLFIQKSINTMVLMGWQYHHGTHMGCYTHPHLKLKNSKNVSCFKLTFNLDHTNGPQLDYIYYLLNNIQYLFFNS